MIFKSTQESMETIILIIVFILNNNIMHVTITTKALSEYLINFT